MSEAQEPWRACPDWKLHDGGYSTLAEIKAHLTAVHGFDYPAFEAARAAKAARRKHLGASCPRCHGTGWITGATDEPG